MITNENAKEFLMARVQCMRDTVEAYFDELDQLKEERLNCCSLPIWDEEDREYLDEGDLLYKQAH